MSEGVNWGAQHPCVTKPAVIAKNYCYNPGDAIEKKGNGEKPVITSIPIYDKQTNVVASISVDTIQHLTRLGLSVDEIISAKTLESPFLTSARLDKMQGKSKDVVINRQTLDNLDYSPGEEFNLYRSKLRNGNIADINSIPRAQQSVSSKPSPEATVVPVKVNAAERSVEERTAERKEIAKVQQNDAMENVITAVEVVGGGIAILGILGAIMSRK
jgi:hypothetical protein